MQSEQYGIADSNWIWFVYV